MTREGGNTGRRMEGVGMEKVDPGEGWRRWTRGRVDPGEGMEKVDPGEGMEKVDPGEGMEKVDPGEGMKRVDSGVGLGKLCSKIDLLCYAPMLKKSCSYATSQVSICYDVM